MACLEYQIHRCSVSTIPMAVTFRTCNVVAESTVHGRMNSGIGSTMRWMTMAMTMTVLTTMTITHKMANILNSILSDTVSKNEN